MHNYEVNLSWVKDRKGTISSPALTQSIEIATPPEFPKGIEGVWSPEHLFAAAVNSCLMTTFLAIAENSKLEFVSLNSTAIGKLDKVDGKYMMTEVVLRPVLVIKDPEQQERAIRILEKSEKACLISNSIKSTIVFEPVIQVN
ncbi:MAG TPA: OsmC family protein [Chitinophagaceae bacterium]|nr:OsmC family protein [Chitinophagaceae bacterium]